MRIDNEDNIHVTWWEESGGEIHYFKILHDGTTEHDIIGSGGRECRITVDYEDNPHVVWYNGLPGVNIWYTKQGSDGVWSNTVKINTETSSNSYDPRIAISPDGIVHVAWIDSGDYNGAGSDRDIFYKKYVDGVWTTTEVLTPESSDDVHDISIEAEFTGAIHLTWSDDDDLVPSGPDRDVFYRSTIMESIAVPHGNLEFQYQYRNVNLKSTSIDWLAVSNNKAMFQGTATKNGEGIYTFRVQATDGDLTGDQPDHFHIKVWEGIDTEADPIHDYKGDLAGGNIKVHKK